MSAEVRQSEDKAQRAMVEAARLAAELRAEQEGGAVLEGEARLLEAQVRDAASKLEEAERSALASGRKAAAKMEARVAELGAELDTETRRRAEAQKNLRRSERRVAELSCQQDEDRKNHERMQVQREISVAFNRCMRYVTHTCRVWLTSSSPSCGHSRSSWRRRRKLLLSTWPSFAKLNQRWARPHKGRSSPSRRLPG